MAWREVGGLITGPQEASWGGNRESTDLSVLFLTSPCSSAVILVTVSVYKEHSRRQYPFGLWPIPSRTEQNLCWTACQRPCSLCTRKPYPPSVTGAEYVSSKRPSWYCQPHHSSTAVPLSSERWKPLPFSLNPGRLAIYMTN